MVISTFKSEPVGLATIFNSRSEWTVNSRHAPSASKLTLDGSGDSCAEAGSGVGVGVGVGVAVVVGVNVGVGVCVEVVQLLVERLMKA